MTCCMNFGCLDGDLWTKLGFLLNIEIATFFVSCNLLFVFNASLLMGTLPLVVFFCIPSLLSMGNRVCCS